MCSYHKQIRDRSNCNKHLISLSFQCFSSIPRLLHLTKSFVSTLAALFTRLYNTACVSQLLNPIKKFVFLCDCIIPMNREATALNHNSRNFKQEDPSSFFSTHSLSLSRRFVRVYLQLFLLKFYFFKCYILSELSFLKAKKVENNH